MDDVTALRDGFLRSPHLHRPRCFFILDRQNGGKTMRCDCGTAEYLDALIAAARADERRRWEHPIGLTLYPTPQARAALTPERLAAALRYQADRICVTFRAHEPPTCETHWSEWPLGVDICEWRQEACAILAALATDEAVP